MPRYFFNLDNHAHDEDREGTELDSPEHARIQAVIFAGDYLSEHPELIWDGSQFRVEVRDGGGTVLLRVMVTAEDPAAA